MTLSVVGAALFGFATGAVLGAIAGGCSSPLFGDPSMLGEDVLAMALVGALAGAVIGGRGSDPLSAANSAPEPLAR
ncbi:MAG: hypothetical protein IT428_28315 [Planctomycetaceae bacterium]|nr:hypothetical protein [Planctomycetaceae bacterium]